jgi:hypothetical protein
MARHNDEGRVFTWNESVIKRAGDHPTVYSALGSHASYETCELQRRQKAPAGVIDDRPACDELRQLRLSPESTRLTDLARVSWGCWEGLFGHRPGNRVYERVPQFIADAPRSPLWQQKFAGVESRPCEGMPDPGSRDGPSEEVLHQPVSQRIRTHAGRLDPLVDECSDWANPPPTGTYLVACDPVALRAYVTSGLENPGHAAVRVDDGDVRVPAVGPSDLPAVRRDATGSNFDMWRITSAAPTSVEVFASCSARDTLISAQFPRVGLRPDRPLRLDDRLGSVWRLRRPDGTTVATARPRAVHGALGNPPKKCGSSS